MNKLWDFAGRLSMSTARSGAYSYLEGKYRNKREAWEYATGGIPDDAPGVRPKAVLDASRKLFYAGWDLAEALKKTNTTT